MNEKKMIRNIFSICLSISLFSPFICSNGLAARVSATSTIEKIHSFSEQIGFDGDLAIVVTNPAPGCDGGFWLRNATTQGYKNTVAILLSAFHANAKINFSA